MKTKASNKRVEKRGEQKSREKRLEEERSLYFLFIKHSAALEKRKREK